MMSLIRNETFENHAPSAHWRVFALPGSDFQVPLRPRNRKTDDLNGSSNGLANPARPTTGLFLRGFAAVIAAALLTCLFVFAPGARAAAPRLFDIKNRTIEEKAPDFVLTDLDGRKFRLSDHRGKRPVLLIFSATWGPSCKDE